MSTPASNDDDAELLAAVTELGSALRELGDLAVTTTAGADVLRTAAAAARSVTAALDGPRRRRDQLPPLDDPVRFRRVYNPVSGVGSPMSPPLVVRQGDDGVVAEVALGLGYEGPPGFVHGGVSALLMDQVLGSAAVAAGLWGMTARLELDYRRPVPLQTPLVLRARVGENSGRRTTITGTIAPAEAPDEPLVQARGIFVVPRAEQLDAYFGTITDASGRHAPPGRAGDGTAPTPD